jgi:hypothetical protein
MPYTYPVKQYGDNVITHRLSFRFVNTTTFDRIRDGKSGVFANPGGSIVRNSAGLYTITLSNKCPAPQLGDITGNVQVEHAAGVPTVFLQGWIVKDSYSATTRSFQIQLLQLPVGAAYVQPAVADPAANDRVCIEFTACISASGRDPA